MAELLKERGVFWLTLLVLSGGLLTALFIGEWQIPAAQGILLAVFSTSGLIFVGMRLAGRRGIRFRSGKALLQTAGATQLLFERNWLADEENAAVSNLISYGSFSQEELLILAASAQSAHFPNGAITALALQKGLTLRPVGNVRAEESGIRAQIGEKRVLLGSASFMRRNRVELGCFAQPAETLAAEGKNPLFLALNEEVKGIFALVEAVKPSVPAAVSALKTAGVSAAMLADDSPRDKLLARQAGMEPLQPSPSALSANEVLLDGDPAAAVRLAKAVRRAVLQNFFWCAGYTVLGALAAALLGNPALNAVIMGLAAVLEIGTWLFYSFKLQKIK